MLKVLELFSGTGSIGKCCKELGYDVLSLDNELPADINIDIMEWDYKIYPKDSFDIIWASPPCTTYSILQGSWIGKYKRVNGELKLFTEEQRQADMNEADKIIKRTLDIIDYFKPYWWFMENPKTGKLKDREIMKNIPYYDVDYCKYSDWGYKKSTRIWTNKEDFNNLMCKKDCKNMNGNIHKARLADKQIKTEFNQQQKYRIPPELIYSLFLD